MKRNAEELIEEISDFLVVYLKSGKVGINSFIKKTDLKISQLEQLLQIHFLLKDDVKQFVRELPVLIRRFKTSTKVKQETYHGQVRGQINWPDTINERLRINAKDKTIFSVSERNREYGIKENLVLREVLQVLHVLLFEKLATDHYKRFTWFKEWDELKPIVDQMVHQNIYLSRVGKEKSIVTDRMVLDTMKHRNPLYRYAAQILYQYRKLLTGKLDEQELQQLLKETFIHPQEEDVLFELYWIIKVIKENTTDAQLELMDGRNTNSLVAQWSDDHYSYKIYHDSTGSPNSNFHVSTEEVAMTGHPFIERKLDSMSQSETLAQNLFGKAFDNTTFWSGRPDMIVEIYEKDTNKLRKVVIGEVKHTNRVEYAITGLRELVDYMKLFKDKNGNYIDEQNQIQIAGMLFTDKIDAIERGEQDLKLNVTDGDLEKKVQFVSFK